MTNKTIKILLLGDEKVGKTSLFDKFIKGSFPSTYTMSKETQFKKGNRNIMTGDTILLNFWDTPGNEERHKHYQTIYVKTSSIIVLFDMTNITTLDNIFKKWIPNFLKFLSIKPNQHFPIIILGNFSDLTNKRALPKNEMDERIKEVTNFTKYYYYQEISVKNETNLPIIMDKLFLFIMNRPKPEPLPPQVNPEENKEKKPEVNKESKPEDNKEVKPEDNKETKPEDNKQINFEDIENVDELKDIIRSLKDEKIKYEKKEKIEKEKSIIMMKTLNEKVESLEQIKKILIEKDKKDKEDRNKLNEMIKKLLEEKQKMTENNISQGKTKDQDGKDA